MRRDRNIQAGTSRKGAALVLLSLAALIVCGAGLVTIAQSTSSSSSLHSTPSSLSQARWLLDEGRIAEARAIYDEQLKRDPRDVEAIRGLALCARDEGDDETAFQYFQKLTTLSPKDFAAWRQQALAASRLGRELEAMTAAQTALSLATKGDRAMTDLVTRLMTSDFDPIGDPFKGVPGRSRNPLDPTESGRSGSFNDPLMDVPRPVPPDPMKGIPGVERK